MCESPGACLALSASPCFFFKGEREGPAMHFIRRLFERKEEEKEGGVEVEVEDATAASPPSAPSHSPESGLLIAQVFSS